MQNLTTDQLHYNKKSNIFSEELSSISTPLCPGGIDPIRIINLKTGTSKDFIFSYADKDGSDEDIYGWNYINKETNTRLLIIND